MGLSRRGQTLTSVGAWGWSREAGEYRVLSTIVYIWDGCVGGIWIHLNMCVHLHGTSPGTPGVCSGTDPVALLCAAPGSVHLLRSAGSSPGFDSWRWPLSYQTHRWTPPGSRTVSQAETQFIKKKCKPGGVGKYVHLCISGKLTSIKPLINLNWSINLDQLLWMNHCSPGLCPAASLRSC